MYICKFKTRDEKSIESFADDLIIAVCLLVRVFSLQVTRRREHWNILIPRLVCVLRQSQHPILCRAVPSLVAGMKRIGELEVVFVPTSLVLENDHKAFECAECTL